MSEEYEETEIDWVGLLGKLWKGRRFIIIFSAVFAAIGIAVALIQPRKYTVTMTLAPEVQNTSSSNLSSITAMLGIGAANSGGTDALNITLFPEICKSTPFLTGLFPVLLTPYVSPKDAKAGAVALPVTVYDHLSGRDKPQNGFCCRIKEFFSRKKEDEALSDTLDLSHLSTMQACVAETLANSISADVNTKTGVTTISVVMDDRQMVTQLADTVCRRLQEYVIMYRTQKSLEDFNFYVKLADEAQAKLVDAQAAYAASVDHGRDIILQSVNSRRDRLRQEAELASQIYSQMAQQREMARAKIQEEKPVFAVIQPATMPQHASNSRKQTVLIWGFLGVLLSCVWVAFGQDFLAKICEGMKKSQAQTE